MFASTITQPVADELRDLRDFLAQLRRDIRVRDLRSGKWYAKVLSAYLAHYEAKRLREGRTTPALEARPELARKLTERAAIVAVVAGASAAAGVTAASVVTAETMGMAAPVALPLAGLGVVSEMLVRSIVHLKLACELAELYGMPLGPGREHELTRLYALAFRAEMHETEDDPGRGLVERITRLQQSGGLGKLIASRLVGETLLRNAIPFADVAVSSYRNWQLTQQFGRFVELYVRRRVAFDAAVDALVQRCPECLALVVEGIWFMFIADGRLTGIETALLAHMMRAQGAPQEVTQQFVSDEADWLERLRAIDRDPEVRTLLVRALASAAGIEGPVTNAERTILERAARTLEVAVPEAPASPAVNENYDTLTPQFERSLRWLSAQLATLADRAGAAFERFGDKTAQVKPAA